MFFRKAGIGLVWGATVFCFWIPAVAQSTSPTLLDRPEVKAMLAARMAKIRNVSDGEFEAAVKRGVYQLDTGLSSMSKKDMKRLARLGEVIWGDCAIYAEFGAGEAKATSGSDKKALGRYNDERLRQRLFEYLKSTLSSHASYRKNSKLDADVFKGGALGKEDVDTRLTMAMGGLKCQLDMDKRKLTGNFEHVYEFYASGMSAADLYRREPNSD